MIEHAPSDAAAVTNLPRPIERAPPPRPTVRSSSLMAATDGS